MYSTGRIAPQRLLHDSGDSGLQVGVGNGGEGIAPLGSLERNGGNRRLMLSSSFFQFLIGEKTQRGDGERSQEILGDELLPVIRILGVQRLFCRAAFGIFGIGDF